MTSICATWIPATMRSPMPWIPGMTDIPTDMPWIPGYSPKNERGDAQSDEDQSQEAQSDDTACLIPNVPKLDDLPCNQGRIIDGDKFYGRLDVKENPHRVELVDPNNDELHAWHRKGHSLFKLDPETGTRQYVTSEQMVPCPQEAATGVCRQRFDKAHRKHHFHYTFPSPVFEPGTGKPVCRYSLTNPNILCWEHTNPEHVKAFHHRD
jgi:hypothetical protein